MKPLRSTAALGLAVAMAFVLLVSAWLQGGANTDIATQQQREAVLLTQAVAASLAGADEAAAVERVRRWKQAQPALESVRVVSGRQLLASTDAADEAPRSLRREEKPIFDLANELRAAAETNTGEGVVRKKTLQVVPGSGRVVLT